MLIHTFTQVEFMLALESVFKWNPCFESCLKWHPCLRQADLRSIFPTHKLSRAPQLPRKKKSGIYIYRYLISYIQDDNEFGHEPGVQRFGSSVWGLSLLSQLDQCRSCNIILVISMFTIGFQTILFLTNNSLNSHFFLNFSHKFRSNP